VSIITLAHLIHYLEAFPSMAETLERIRAYRARYGVTHFSFF
jgi:hypothetical protein